MKRIITLLLVAVMLVSTMVFSTGAAGTLIFSDNFDDGFLPRNWITDKEGCKYEWDKYSGSVHGYHDARVLQSNYLKKNDKQWAQFYGKVDVQFRAFDDMNWNGNPHTFKIWYHDLFENSEDETLPQGAIYYFAVEIETGKAYLKKTITYKYYDENNVAQSNTVDAVIAEGQIDGTIEVGETAPWYEIGIRVADGKIEGYFDQKLVLSAEAKEDDEKVGHIALTNVDSTVGSQKSPVVLWNGEQGSACWLAFDNFEIWTPDYDFEEVVYGDANKDASVNLSDVSLMLKHIASWSELDIDLVAADVNVDNTVNLTDASTVLKIVAGWEDVVLGPTA